MKRKLTVLTLCLLIAAILSGCSLQTQLGETQIKYSVADGCASVKELPDSASASEITIPDEYEGVAVTEICDFAGCNLENAEVIKIGKNVKTIGEWAFANNQKLKRYEVSPENEYFCSVDGVLFTEDMKTLLFYPPAKDLIQTDEYDENGKTQTVLKGNYTIPESVEKIGKRAFYKCSYLVGIEFPQELKIIEEKAFFKCSALEKAEFYENLEEIGKDAFGYCTALKEITVPKNVSYIGDYAFFNCTGLYTVNMYCSQSSVVFGKDWQPTDNGLKIDELEINWYG